MSPLDGLFFYGYNNSARVHEINKLINSKELLMDCEYENPWIYMERAFNSDDVGDYFGFVLCVVSCWCCDCCV